MSSKRSSGFTLVEMIIAIVIIGVGLAGVLTAFSTVVQSSADPMIHKQMLAIAEEMMEEILLKPFAVGPGTAATAGPANCGAAASVRTNFDDVLDYNTYRTTGICDVEGAAVGGLGGYDVRVVVVYQADLGLAAANVLRVTVTVTSGTETVTLVGWRTNYA